MTYKSKLSLTNLFILNLIYLFLFLMLFNIKKIIHSRFSHSDNFIYLYLNGINTNNMQLDNSTIKKRLLLIQISKPFVKKSFTWIICMLLHTIAFCQQINDTSASDHEISVYIFEPAQPINWENPATLFQSVKKSYLASFFHKKKRFLGHLAFSLKSNLLSKPLYVSIAATDKKGFFKQLFQRKIGLGILGYPFTGALESDQYILSSINYNAKKNKLAILKYHINEAAAKRLIAFFESFTSTHKNNISPSQYYGGAFWPLYEDEGAGCSALTIAALEVAGIPLPEKENWKIQCKIPIHLVGGTIDKNKKVGVRRIRSTKNWHANNGTENIDYIHFEIYEPYLLWLWFQKKYAVLNHESSLKSSAIIPSLSFNYSNNTINFDKPIFTKRPHENFFLQHYLPTQKVVEAKVSAASLSK